jgi:hypothetical protein
VASTGEDNTLRLWPMPDLSQPPLHTLPRDELIAKLKSLTNLRAVPDPEAEGGWKVELAPFPGWKEVPTWCPPQSIGSVFHRISVMIRAASPLGHPPGLCFSQELPDPPTPKAPRGAHDVADPSIPLPVGP